ncbi:hypothetical protein L336_0562 [Candidatus Saccharimonas aalborgensis]|uniref:Uncharacterized protein n=1 Tax=Candidatus Saccharimonas aalborgensis TaxID=1332188 RepID=R4PVK0_9BACT|nr:hypothetical protein L336_0562 [Candidatus Saccharimonas aalborgensis]
MLSHYLIRNSELIPQHRLYQITRQRRYIDTCHHDMCDMSAIVLTIFNNSLVRDLLTQCSRILKQPFRIALFQNIYVVKHFPTIRLASYSPSMIQYVVSKHKNNLTIRGGYGY